MISIARIELEREEEKNTHKFGGGSISTQSNSFYNDVFFSLSLVSMPKNDPKYFFFVDGFKLFTSVRYCRFKRKNEFEI